MGTIGASVDKTVAKLEHELELWGAKLDELVAKVEVVGHEKAVDAKKHLADLKVRLTVARAKLDEAKAAGGDKWGKFKTGLEASWKELEAAFSKLNN